VLRRHSRFAANNKHLHIKAFLCSVDAQVISESPEKSFGGAGSDAVNLDGTVPVRLSPVDDQKAKRKRQKAARKVEAPSDSGKMTNQREKKRNAAALGICHGRRNSNNLVELPGLSETAHDPIAPFQEASWWELAVWRGQDEYVHRSRLTRDAKSQLLLDRLPNPTEHRIFTFFNRWNQRDVVPSASVETGIQIYSTLLRPIDLGQ
jgi:hypothetical protein